MGQETFEAIKQRLEILNMIGLNVGGCAVLLQHSTVDGDKYFFIEKTDEYMYIINSQYFYLYPLDTGFEKMELLFKYNKL